MSSTPKPVPDRPQWFERHPRITAAVLAVGFVAVCLSPVPVFPR